MTVSTKEGNLVISELSTPDRVEPGEEGVARVVIENLATVISPWDADRCVGDSVTVGYKYRVVLRVGGKTYESPVSCLGRLVGMNSDEFEITFEAPLTTGTTDVEARIELPKSDRRSDWLSSRLEVYGAGDDTPEEPPEDDDRPDWLNDLLDGDDGDDGDDDGGDPPWPFGGDGDPFEKIDTLILLVILFAGFYAAGQLFDINIGGGTA